LWIEPTHGTTGLGNFTRCEKKTDYYLGMYRVLLPDYHLQKDSFGMGSKSNPKFKEERYFAQRMGQSIFQ
jgi:hypothetical protein